MHTLNTIVILNSDAEGNVYISAKVEECVITNI